MGSTKLAPILMLTLDTSAVYAILNRRDPFHARMVRARDSDPGPYFVSLGALSELAYMVESNLSLSDLDGLLSDMASGAYALDWYDEDIRRIRRLVRRYGDLPLGVADSAVIACAERHGGYVLTTDYRHFPLVAAGERSITVIALPST